MAGCLEGCKIMKPEELMTKKEKKKRKSLARRSKLRVHYLRREREVFRMLMANKDEDEIMETLNITKSAFRSHYSHILDKLRREDDGRAKRELDRRIAQYDYAGKLAHDSYLRSCQDEVQITTQTKLEKCGECKGKKVVGPRGEKSPCLVCNGEGVVSVECTTKKVKGQVGDASLLKEYRENVKAAAALEGLALPKEVKHTVDGRIEHSIQAISDDNQFKDASPEMILKLKSVMAEMEEEKKQKMLEGDIVDVEVIEKNNNGDDKNE